jgi:hypothetical protein
VGSGSGGECLDSAPVESGQVGTGVDDHTQTGQPGSKDAIKAMGREIRS